MNMIGKLPAILLSITLLAGLAGRARGQCETTANLDGFNVPPGTDGAIAATLEWDLDTNSGPAPNLMVIAGDFNTAGDLTNLNGLVAWNGSAFLRLGATNDTNRPNRPLPDLVGRPRHDQPAALCRRRERHQLLRRRVMDQSDPSDGHLSPYHLGP